MRRLTHTAVTDDGVAITVRDFGGGGCAAVLAHATGFHGEVWAPVVAGLRGRLRCVAVDHRGHGSSGRPPGWDHRWEGFASDLLAAVDALALARPVGIGHSSGATALLLAEQARPGTFRSLYCFEPVVVPGPAPLGPDPGNWLAERARRRRQRFASTEEAIAHFRARPPYARWCPDALAAYVAGGLGPAPGGGVRLRCRPDDEAGIYEMATAHGGFQGLDAIRCPVTVAWGEASEAFSSATASAMCAKSTMVETEILADLGHLGPLEDPGAVASSILRHSRPPTVTINRSTGA